MFYSCHYLYPKIYILSYNENEFVLAGNLRRKFQYIDGHELFKYNLSTSDNSYQAMVELHHLLRTMALKEMLF